MDMKQLKEELEQVQNDKHEFADWCFGAVPKMVDHIDKSNQLIANLFNSIGSIYHGNPDIVDIDKLKQDAQQLGFNFSGDSYFIGEDEE